MSTEMDMPPDYNRGPQILAICGTLVGVALVTVALRIWVRAAMIKHVGWDDYVMIAAMTVMFAEMMVIIPQVHYGAGRHWQYIQPPENVVTGLHLNFVTQPLCLIALCLTKVSVGLFLLRMTPSTRYKQAIWATIIFTILSSVGNILTVFFQCKPLAFTWDTSIEGGSCIPQSHLKFAAYFNSSVSVLTDVLFAVLPIPMIWRVQLNWKFKAAVAGILSLGIFAAVAAIVKITFLGNYGKHGDFLFDSSDISIWTTVEICTAIVAGSFPCLKPLFKRILDASSARHGSAPYGSKYNNNGYIRNTGTERSRPGREDEVEMYGRSKHTASIHAGYRSNMDSEESIIGQHGLSADGITKTTQVSISVDEEQTKKPKDLI